jgi:hypothetical protein
MACIVYKGDNTVYACCWNWQWHFEKIEIFLFSHVAERFEVYMCAHLVEHVVPLCLRWPLYRVQC